MTLRTLAMLDVGASNGRQGVTYHLAHKLVDRGDRVLVVDLGADAALTERLLGEAGLYELWLEEARSTPWWLAEQRPTPIEVREGLDLLPGDPRLALREAASQNLEDWRAKILELVTTREIHWLILALDPTLPACFPLASLTAGLIVIAKAAPRALRMLPISGQLYRNAQAELAGLGLPMAQILGYLVPQPLNRVFGSNDLYAACQAKMPAVFRSSFELPEAEPVLDPRKDPWCLGQLPRPAALYELGVEVGKPVFHLRPANGASETMMHAVFDAERRYDALVETICQSYDSKAAAFNS